MPSLVKKIEENNVDGRMLLDDFQAEDLNALVPFPPLRRKLVRNIDLLRQQAANVLPAPANMDEVSSEIQRSLDQLNETLRTLAETVSQESHIASGKLQPLPSDERRRSAAHVQPNKLIAMEAESAAVKIQAVVRGRQVRTQKLKDEGDGAQEGGTRVWDADERHRTEVPVEEVQTAENKDDNLDRRAPPDIDRAAAKIQAVARGRQDRNRVIKMKMTDHCAIGAVGDECDVGGEKGDVGGDDREEDEGLAKSGGEDAVIVADVEDSATARQE